MIRPLPEFHFEEALSQNLSIRQLVFLPKSAKVTPQKLLQLNTTVYRTTVVPNDPSDFSRNSYDMNTVNSIMSKLGHRHVDLLKLEHIEDVTHSFEIPYFMAKDGILTRFDQLHIVIEIDKVDESYLYNWYKTVYVLFHQAGFRLYHTSASSPLCLQVTMMESCHYFMSWVRDPGPQAAVLYPPAMDGSEESEAQRLKDFLDLPEQLNEDVISVVLSSSVMLRLSRQVVMLGSDNCHILVFQFKTGSVVVEEVSALHVRCSVVVLTPLTGKQEDQSLSSFSVRAPQGVAKTMTLSEGLSRLLPGGEHTSIIYINLGSSGWSVLSALMESGDVQHMKQLVLVAPVYPAHDSNKHKVAQVLRQRYSELKRLTAFHLTLSEATTQLHGSLGFRRDRNVLQMSFVKS
ncbi:uncharacterized protein LOC143280864 isoform X2 [Babylonia areolata]|uniref:uncharacterized protein LOC143280864 isoform X2 n=1 Tax=Babylonia areolata TaxID=304850 RepID=UPI003FD4ACB8